MKLRTSLTALGVGAMIVTGVWTVVGAQGSVADATMTLAMSGGACTKTLSGNDGGSRIRAKKNGSVRWTIINNCTADATVAVDDWILKSDRSGNNPFDPSGNSDCTAKPGKECKINLHIKSSAGVGTYSYSTSVNGVKKDPDLIIEM